MPKVDLSAIEQTNSTGYPPPYDRDVAGRHYRRVGAEMGLTRLGMSQCTLEPGAWSSQRHWHFTEDEFGDLDEMVEVWRDDLLLDAIGRTRATTTSPTCL